MPANYVTHIHFIYILFTAKDSGLWIYFQQMFTQNFGLIFTYIRTNIILTV